MTSTAVRAFAWWAFLCMVVCAGPHAAPAVIVGQGTFDTALGQDFMCSAGGGTFSATFSHDDRTFPVPLADGSLIDINFSLLGTFHATGSIDCTPDVGGNFSESAINDDGDFQWIGITGEYVDRFPGEVEGDPFPFVGTARCATTRQDDFKTLCDNFELSFNGLARAEAPDNTGFFRFYSGGFNLRAVQLVAVPPSDGILGVQSAVDGPTGDLPDVQVTFDDGILAGGELRVTTLADAHGTIPLGMDLPARGTTELDHGNGPVPFFPGGDERFVELSTDAALPGSASIEVCLPMPKSTSPGTVRPAHLLHGEGSDPLTRTFVDRTVSADPTSGKVCARVSSFSKFAIATSDVCGGGQAPADGLLTIAGGLIGKKTVVVDGLTDCTLFPANLPKGLRQYCVPDADTTPGQCTVALALGINRGGCNRVNGSDTHSPAVIVSSYSGELKRGGTTVDLTPIFGPQIAALTSPIEASIAPVPLALPVVTKITSYKIKHQLTGVRPGTSGQMTTDKDVLKIQCVDPTRF